MTKRKLSLAEPTDIPSRFAAIDSAYKPLPRREKGDLDCWELAEHWDISPNQARRRMETFARKHKTWKFMLVRDPNRKNSVVVLREVVQ